MSNPIIRLEALKQFVRNLILPLSEDVSGLKDSVPSSTDKQNWDSAKKHADSAHARTDATKVEKSTTNGNILVNGKETIVYTHPSGTNPHGTTKNDVGLGNVPNVSTNDQTPTYTQATTRANITSGEKLSISLGKIMRYFADLKNVAFSGSYSDLSNKPSTVTTSADGFMSSKDKSKLDGIANGANAYTHPTNSGNKHIPSGGSSGQILRWSADGTAVWGADNNTTYTPATLGNGYGTCSTEAATAAKVVSLPNYALVVNGIVAVKFTYDVPAGATMNINSRGAKAIYYNGAVIKAGMIKAGDLAVFIYADSKYHLIAIDQISSNMRITMDTDKKVYIEYAE